MNLVVKSPVWDDLREIGLRIAEGNPDAAEHFNPCQSSWECRESRFDGAEGFPALPGRHDLRRRWSYSRLA
jgi:hypothetical protein